MSKLFPIKEKQNFLVYDIHRCTRQGAPHERPKTLPQKLNHKNAIKYENKEPAFIFSQLKVSPTKLFFKDPPPPPPTWSFNFHRRRLGDNFGQVLFYCNNHLIPLIKQTLWVASFNIAKQSSKKMGLGWGGKGRGGGWQQKKSSENSTIPLSGAHRTVHLWQQHCTVTLAIYWFQLIEIAAMFAYNFFILEFGVPPLNSSHTPRLRNDDVKEPAAKYLDTNFGLVQ